MSDFMGTKEAAEKWRCNQSEVAKWCREGKIPTAEKIDGVWCIPKDVKCPIVEQIILQEKKVVNELKLQIIRELEEEIEKEKVRIRELNQKIYSEKFMKSTVRGGLGASSARTACDNRADTARAELNVVEERNKWKKDMLEKYK